MPVQPKDLLLFSESIFNNAVEEVEFRTCANRAYYACHQEARRIVPQTSGYSTRRKSKRITHKDLGDLLQSHKQNTLSIHRSQQDKNIIKIGVLLKQCFVLREKADYRYNDSFKYNQAAMSIRLAEIILKMSQTIP